MYNLPDELIKIINSYETIEYVVSKQEYGPREHMKSVTMPDKISIVKSNRAALSMTCKRYNDLLGCDMMRGGQEYSKYIRMYNVVYMYSVMLDCWNRIYDLVRNSIYSLDASDSIMHAAPRYPGEALKIIKNNNVHPKYGGNRYTLRLPADKYFGHLIKDLGRRVAKTTCYEMKKSAVFHFLCLGASNDSIEVMKFISEFPGFNELNETITTHAPLSTCSSDLPLLSHLQPHLHN